MFSPEPGSAEKTPAQPAVSSAGFGDPAPIADDEDEEADGKRTGWGRLWPILLAIAATVLVVTECGVIDAVFADPTGEQVLTGFENQLKAAGISDAAWTCIESEMRDGGHVAKLNKADMDDIQESLDSPQHIPTPELARFEDAFALVYKPGQPTSCMTRAEYDALNLPDP